jgi:hypothetical protein
LQKKRAGQQCPAFFIKAPLVQLLQDTVAKADATGRPTKVFSSTRTISFPSDS